jgi:hypothetical protein
LINATKLYWGVEYFLKTAFSLLSSEFWWNATISFTHSLHNSKRRKPSQMQARHICLYYILKSIPKSNDHLHSAFVFHSMNFFIFLLGYSMNWI